MAGIKANLQDEAPNSYIPAFQLHMWPWEVSPEYLLFVHQVLLIFAVGLV